MSGTGGPGRAWASGLGQALSAVATAMIAFGGIAQASDPELVARSARSLWPEPIDSPAAFDRASRGEIVVFAAALDQAARMDENALAARFHIEQPDTAYVQKVYKRLSAILLDNYEKARRSCNASDMFCDVTADTGALAAADRAASAGLPEKFRAWHANAAAFAQVYAAETVRLAALFPQISSEVDIYSPIESDGFEFPDKEFLLSFDDGPTNNGGQTDLLLKTLKQEGLHAVFFLVGEQLAARLEQHGTPLLNELYRGQCVAVHGWQHLSHATWPEWQASIVRTRDLVQRILPEAYHPWFRPPYGERRSDNAGFFAQQGLGVRLWNINSQDWNDFMTADEVAERVARLMLLWRRGVILLHDVHPRAAVAVPRLTERYRRAGLVWQDCR